MEHLATVSNLNSSYVDLLWVELGLGFDNKRHLSQIFIRKCSGNVEIVHKIFSIDIKISRKFSNVYIDCEYLTLFYSWMFLYRCDTRTGDP